ncbi:MAG: glycosyltransferase family 25 protein [Hyphomonadaceae bacterium]
MSAPPIFLINLDRDTEKRARMEARLAALGLSCERFPAVLGAALSPEELARWRPHPNYWLERRPFALGEIGNVLSHRALNAEIARRNLPCAIVLEDDVELSDDFKCVLEALPALSARYDVVKLEGLDWNGRYFVRRIGALGERALLLPRYPAVGCAGYFVTRAAAARLAKAVDVVVEPFDHTLTDYARLDLRFAELYPHPVWQAAGMSEISVDRIAIQKHRPNMEYRLRRKGHKMLRRWRQRLYEARRLGLWTLWTPQQPTLRQRSGEHAHVAARPPAA